MPNSKRYSKHTCIYLASYFNNNYAKLLQHYLTKTLLMVMLYLLPEQRNKYICFDCYQHGGYLEEIQLYFSF